MADIEVLEPGSTVSARSGDELVVRLPEVATTGYQWTVDQITGPLRVVSSEVVPTVPPDGAPPGSGGERFIRVATTGVGNGAVRLELRRVWETEPADRFEFLVRVG
jgi:inhibitor of cysteine peptidase